MIQNIEIDKLVPHKNNPRKDLGDLTELAESIKARGVMQNLTVVDQDKYKPDSYKKYTVIIGHRRLAAAKLAGLTELPCAVVEMTEQEQIATMLLENMQRADLTIYEQARGFQMMLDFGDTVKSIAEKTGFSETTVRHRVKLNELDQEKLAETMERNVRIEDYISLEKIKDQKLRNDVLEHIGTNNFRWRFNQAVEQEALPKRKEGLLQFLEGWAKELQKEPENPYDYMYYFSQYEISDFKKPKDASKGNYSFHDTGRGIRLYKRNDELEKPQVSATEKAFKEAEAKIKELTQQAYKLRREFVLNFSGGKAKAKEVMDFAMVRLIRYGGEDLDKPQSLLGIDAPAEEDELSWNEKIANGRERLMQEYIKHPERTMLVIAWATIDNGGTYYEAQSWNSAIRHRPNDTLDAIYDGLIALGYEMSDDEAALRNGTHELFKEYCGTEAEV